MGFNPLPNSPMASYERGFGDFTMKADMESMKEINYVGENRQLLFFADLYDQQTDKHITHAPRYLLRKSIQNLEDLGLSVLIQCDLNFTVFQDKYRKLAENFNNAQAITEHSNLYNTLYKQNLDDFFNKIKTSLKLSNIEIEKITGDKAPGQFRISLSEVNALQFCDNITLLKLVKKINFSV